ncbi:MAG: efflux RND transporter periplasmic adaptor subunit [Halioglobus sp.]
MSIASRTTLMFIGSLSLLTPLSQAGEPVPVLGCLLEPTTVAELSASTRGKVAEIQVKRGDVVKKGQVLARLESGVEELNVELAKKRAGMSMDLQSKEARLDLSELNEKRTRELAEKNMMSSMQLDEAATEKTIAQLEAFEAKERYALSKVELRRAEELLRQRYIHSTLDGIVVEMYKEVGEFVDEEPLLKLAQLDPLKVDVIASVDLFGEIKEGTNLTVSPELAGVPPFVATVDVVDKIIDGASGTFRFSMVLPNPEYAVPAGLNCQLERLP